MGHSTVRIKLDTYGHLLKTENPEAASRLGGAIFSAGHKTVTNKKGVTS